MSTFDNTYMRLLTVGCQLGLSKSGVAKPEAVPMLIIAAPGMAKTESINAIGDMLSQKHGYEFPVETIAIPQATPEQIGGLPVPDESRQTTSLYPMAAGKKLLAQGRGIFFFDELTSGSEQTAAACLTLIQSGRFGDAVLPPSVARIAAGNLPDKATNGRALTPPESNRFCFIQWPKPSEFAEAWVDYMRGGPGLFKDLGNVVLPDNWEVDYYLRAASIVTNYIKKNPMALHSEPDVSDATKAWASPRSWRNGTRFMAAAMSLGERETQNLAFAGLSGCIGYAEAERFHTWLVEQKLVDPEEVLAKGSTWEFGQDERKRPDRMLLTAEAICYAAIKKVNNPDEYARRWLRATEVLEKLNHAGTVSVCGEILALAAPPVKDIGGKIPKFYSSYMKTSAAINKTEIETKINGRPKH